MAAQQLGMRHRAREVKSVLRGETATHAILRSRLAFLFVATLVVDAVGTVLVYVFEDDRGRSDVHTLGDAFFWVSAQLTTVSSQMSNPVTTPGRIVDIGLEVWAISVVATLAAALASFFRTRHVELMRDRP